MKKMMTLSLVMVISLVLMGGQAWAGRVAKRQHRQSSRISQGVKSGQLTCGETRALVRQQRHIQRAKKRAWSDGHLTAREKARLELMQDRASRNIYRLKHNGKTR